MDRRRNDIERYLRGEMSPAEMHSLEREALRDPFLAEALEGIDQTGTEHFLLDLKELHHTVHQRTRNQRPAFISMWNWSIGIAAGLILIGLAAVYIISDAQRRQDGLLAMKKEEEKRTKETAPIPDSVASGPFPAAIPDDATQGEEAKQQARSGRPAAESPTANSRGARENEAVKETDVDDADPIGDRIFALEEPVENESLEGEPAMTISGTVISAEDSQPIPGVSVRVKGTDKTTSTDAEGRYKIEVPDPKQSLVFNFIGMTPEEVSPLGKLNLDVTLEPDMTALSEVVVIGYGDEGDGPSRQYPEPQGGKRALEKYLSEKMLYPRQALEHKVEGKVTVQFTVAPDGTLRDFQVLKGLGFGCDDEAIRLLKEGPAWSPSRKDAQPIAGKVRVRVKFSLPKEGQQR